MFSSRQAATTQSLSDPSSFLFDNLSDALRLHTTSGTPSATLLGAQMIRAPEGRYKLNFALVIETAQSIATTIVASVCVCGLKWALSRRQCGRNIASLRSAANLTAVTAGSSGWTDELAATEASEAVTLKSGTSPGTCQDNGETAAQ